MPIASRSCAGLHDELLIATAEGSSIVLATMLKNVAGQGRERGSIAAMDIEDRKARA
jgi:hypothetical protein